MYLINIHVICVINRAENLCKLLIGRFYYYPKHTSHKPDKKKLSEKVLTNFITIFESPSIKKEDKSVYNGFKFIFQICFDVSFL